MAAGLVTVNILDGDGTTRTARFWSSDGTTAGLLYSPAVIVDGAGSAVDFTTASPVSQSGTWTDVGVTLDSSSIRIGATSLTPKFAAISSTGSGDTVALVSSKIIRVLSMVIVVAAATTVKFQSGASTDKTGAMSLAANGGFTLPFNPSGWFQTASGEKLNHVLGTSVGIAGSISYIEV